MWGASGDLGGSVGRHVRSKLKSLEAEKSFGTRLRSSETFENLRKNVFFTLQKVVYVNVINSYSQKTTSKTFRPRLRSSETFKNLLKPSKTLQNLQKNEVFDLVEGYFCQ